MIFVDPDGKEIAKLAKRDAASVASQIEDVAKKHPGKK